MIFTGMHCFMPNARLESFNWIYSHAVRSLWPSMDVTKNVVSIIMDGEPALYQPLENEITSIISTT
jgi:wyosine [tRNA(Phe)-imidazoG37] synthetase (radical SAM superfamily)